MPTNRPTLSVILPTYCPHPEVEAKLTRCVESIFSGSDQSNFELIVSEQRGKGTFMNISCDGTDDEKPEAFLHLSKPCGFARAVNLGVSLSHGEFLFIINNDIILPPNWDTLFLTEYERLRPIFNDRIALLAPIDQTISTGPILPPTIWQDSWWSCVLIPRWAWEEVGPLNEHSLPYRFHDQEWSIRARANTSPMAILRSSAIRVHHDEASTYRHMKADVNEGVEEAYMRLHWGVPTYADYIRIHGHGLSRPRPSTLPGKEDGK